MTNNSYREIIYLDETELTSALAQFDGGLKQSLTATSATSSRSGHENQVNGKASGGFNALVASANGEAGYNYTTNKSNAKTVEEAMEIYFGDYELNQLLTRLKGILTDENDSEEGTFIKTTSAFRLFDFATLNAALNVPLMKKIMSKIQNEDGTGTQWDKGAEEGFKLMGSITEFAGNFVPDTILCSLNGATVYAEKSNFRMSSPQLNLLQSTNRKVTVLGITESVAGSPKNDMDKLANEMGNGQLDRLGTFASSFSETMLTALGITKKGNKLIKPIALYFEDVNVSKD
jgi:hypothetical protein